MSISQRVIVTFLSLFLLGCFSMSAIADVPDQINYQGNLIYDESPADGQYDMHFYTYNSLSGRFMVPSAQYANPYT